MAPLPQTEHVGAGSASEQPVRGHGADATAPPKAAELPEILEEKGFAGELRAAADYLVQHGLELDHHAMHIVRGAMRGGHIGPLEVLEDELKLNVGMYGKDAINGLAQGGVTTGALQWLEKRGVSLDEYCWAAFTGAARTGQVASLEFLEQQGLDLLAFGMAAVEGAAHGGHMHILDWLEQRGVDARGKFRHTAAFFAARGGQFEKLQVWMGCEMERFLEDAKIRDRLLSGAVFHGDVNQLIQLLNVRVADISGQSSRGRHLPLLQQLSVLARDLPVKEVSDPTPAARDWLMRSAVVWEDIESLEWMSRESGTELDEKTLLDCLHWALRSGATRSLSWLKQHGCRADRGGRNVFFSACDAGSIPALQWLQEDGAHLSKHVGTILEGAAKGGHLHMLHWLVQPEQDDAFVKRDPSSCFFGCMDGAQYHVFSWLTKQQGVPVDAGEAIKGAVRGAKYGGTTATIMHSLKRLEKCGVDLAKPKDPEVLHSAFWAVGWSGNMEVLDWLETSSKVRLGGRGRSTAKLAHMFVRGAADRGNIDSIKWIEGRGVPLRLMIPSICGAAAVCEHWHVLYWIESRGFRIRDHAFSTVLGGVHSKSIVLFEKLLELGVSEVDYHGKLQRHLPPLSQIPTNILQVLAQLDEIPLADFPIETSVLREQFQGVHNHKALANFISTTDPMIVELALNTVFDTDVVLKDASGEPITHAQMDSYMRATTITAPDGADIDVEEIRRQIAPARASRFQRAFQGCRDLPVKFARIQLRGATSPVVLRALSLAPLDSTLDSVAAKSIILASWQQSWWQIATDLFMASLQLGAVLALTMRLPAAEAREQGEALFRAMELPAAFWALLVAWLFAACDEAHQIYIHCCRNPSWRASYCTMTNALDWLRIATVCSLLLFLVLEFPASVVAPMLSYVGFVSWWSLLYALRGFDTLGQRILPVIGAFKEVLPFSMVVIFYFGGFVHAFSALSISKPFTEILLSSYRLGFLGDFDMDELIGEESEGLTWSRIQQAWFILMTFLFTLAMMNIFIGIMTNAFDAEVEKVETGFLRERASQCLRYASQPAWLRVDRVALRLLGRRQNGARGTRTIWVCMQDRPEEEAADLRSLRQTVGVSERRIARRLEDIQESMEKRVEDVQKGMEKRMDEMEERLLKALAKRTTAGDGYPDLPPALSP